MRVRKAAVCGTFYPKSSLELTKYFTHFNERLIKSNTKIKHPKAIIVPHAGYIYSGYTANVAYSLLSGVEPKRIVVIGPSHKIFLEGASIALYNEYETPYGNLQIDLAYSSHLKEKYAALNFNPLAHCEHSTETQMPFIKKYFPATSIVEIVYGKIDFMELSTIISEIMLESDNYVVISTDLSHFYTQKEANVLDSICLNAIENLSLKLLNDGCEACGMTGIQALVQWAKSNSYISQVLDYRTSMDASGDSSRVVGYASAIIGE
ncbi:MAG: AmmeMemoRadiSam system protein B [Candidatus Marinarcus sp.]|uniref:AmmeMemoRadiSam system protein B n=1 Tax=Candidatus Marinarcus sp. TaxID=3100987 RepID=UPI003AFFEF67